MALNQPAQGVIADLEHRVDRHFRESSLPGADRVNSLWHLLTAAEDVLRLPPTGTSYNQHMIAVGNSVTNLQRSIDLIHSNLSIPGQLPRVPLVDDKQYCVASRLYVRGRDYDLATEAFSAFHGDQAVVAVSDDGNALHFGPAGQFAAYQALAVLTNESAAPTAVDILCGMFRAPDALPQCMQKIVRRTKRRSMSGRSIVSYDYVPALARELAEMFPAHRRTVPDGWFFPWGTAADSFAVAHALAIRCLYHAVAVHFGALALNVDGIGIDGIVFVSSKHAIRRELAALAEVPLPCVDRVIGAITYGSDVATPDIALQPLLTVDKQRCMIPPVHLLALDHERNMLSLHSRVDKKSFDSQSSLFEKQMLLRASTGLTPTRWRVISGLRFSAGAQSEEIDLVLVDEDRRAVVVCEFRWMLRPGTMREVVRRREDAAKKVKQLARKLDFCRSHQPAFLERLGACAAGASEWSIDGIVVLDGVAGAPSGAEVAVPVIPLRTLIEGGLSHSDLRAAWLHWRSLDWLPREGSEYVAVNARVDFGDIRIFWTGVGIPDAVVRTDDTIEDPLLRAHRFALDHNKGLSNPKCIAALLPYPAILASFDHVEDLRGLPEGHVLGTRILARLRETSQLLGMIDATVHVATSDASVGDVARMVKKQMDTDRSQGVLRKPRAYYVPAPTGIAVAVLVADEFWNGEW